MHKYLNALEVISNILRSPTLDDTTKLAQISDAVDGVNSF